MKPIKKIKGHKRNPINTVAWSRDKLASGGADSTIRLWNIDGKSLKVINVPDYEILCVAWSSDEILATSGGKKIRLWNSSGDKIRDFDGKTNSITRIV